MTTSRTFGAIREGREVGGLCRSGSHEIAPPAAHLTAIEAFMPMTFSIPKYLMIQINYLFIAI